MYRLRPVCGRHNSSTPTAINMIFSFFPLSWLRSHPYLVTLLASFVTVVFRKGMFSFGQKRVKKIPFSQERVLIIGATSGVGRKLVGQYARRGAKVCIVGRRAELITEVETECKSYAKGKQEGIIGVVADATKVETLVELRDIVKREFKGLDTLHIVAGVSALKPLLELADSPRGIKETTVEGVKQTAAIAQKAIDGNFTGPLQVAIPLLISSSPAPSIHLVSSVGALIPAPTRSLYCASKASSLMLFRSLAIEHPTVHFSHICPGTIEGNFRAGAVDGGGVGEILEGALTVEKVAQRCMQMVDCEEGLVMIPWKYHAALWLSLTVPSFINARARRKYNYITS